MSTAKQSKAAPGLTDTGRAGSNLLASFKPGLLCLIVDS